MERDLVTVARDVALDALQKLLLERNLGGAPVVDASGRAVGFVAAADVIRVLREAPPDVDGEGDGDGSARPEVKRPSLVGDVMRAPPPSVRESASVSEAIAAIARHRVHRVLAVASDERVVGVLAAADVLRWIANAPTPAAPADAFANALTTSSEVVALGVDANGRIVDVSAGACTLLGRPRAELQGTSFAELLDARDRGRGLSGNHFALRMLRSDGATLTVEWTAATTSGAGRLLVGHDVTAALRTRSRLEAELAIATVVERATGEKEAANRALALLARSEGWKWAALWWVDPSDHRLLLRATWPFDGEPAMTEPGLAMRAWKRGAPLWVVERGKPGGARGECAVPLRHRDAIVGVVEIGGQLGPIDGELQLLFEGVARALAGAAQGASAPRPASPPFDEPRISEAERLATLGSLAGGVAHEINNALTWVRLSLGRLLTFELSRAPHTPTRSHRIELLRDVREGVHRVEAVARALGSFSQIDDEAVGPVDVVAILEHGTQVIANEVRHRARLTTAIGALPMVRGSTMALRQVVLNVLQNATQAIAEGAASENELRIRAWEESGNVVIEVSDTGVGIPEERLPRIFEPFFTTRERSGIGLGLSVARDVVERLGGTITAESTPRHGTQIRITLPAMPRPAPSAAPAGDEAPWRCRILVVDDDRPVAEAVALDLDGHEVVMVGSGRDALARLREDDAFDVVLCDLMMPEMTGMDLFETVTRENPALAERFVFMTGGAFTRRAQRFLAEVKNARVQKPFHPTALESLVRGLASRNPRPRG
jgi:signal transduction histidine kinase/predicted transcriptional regulator